MSRTDSKDLPNEPAVSNKDQSGSGQAPAERAPTKKEQKQVDTEEHTSARDKLSDALDS